MKKRPTLRIAPMITPQASAKLRLEIVLILICIAASAGVLQAIEEPPALRLPGTAIPRSYSVELTILPERNDFSGSVAIDLELQESTSMLWLNANDLKFEEVYLLKEKVKLIPQIRTQPKDFVGFEFSEPVAPGPAKLFIRYSGTISDKNNDGIFKQKDGNEWYVYTQFQPLDARRAFPCFDEPSFKTPWQLTLHVQPNQSAVSNTPVVSETPKDGNLKAVRFAQTLPLPSYLIAFAVGPFEFVDAGKAGIKPTPIRIITPKGRTREARWAAESTGPILEHLENYFGIPYPYEKLDQIAIPMVGFAMEHPGLITYGQVSLLTRPEEETIRGRRSYAFLCAHEVAHQWFGNYVTMKWWDDIWLNESFANWITQKILEEWKPEWQESVDRVAKKHHAMENDALVSARRIREPIRSNDDIERAFDNITYGKGKAILGMFESWIGKEKFRLAVQQYLKKYAHGVANTDDFLSALSSGMGTDVKPAFSTFLDQSGAPLVSVSLKCDDSPPKLLVTQKRYVAAGVNAKAQLWQVPVCVKYMEGQEVKRECVLLKAPQINRALSTNSCPSSLIANADSSGYYHVLYDAEQLHNVLNTNSKLTEEERTGILGDLRALMSSGDLEASEVLSVLPFFLQKPNRHMASASYELIYKINQHLVSDALRPGLSHYVRELYGEIGRKLGWEALPGESEDSALMRPTVLLALADEGADRDVTSQAYKVVMGWMQDRSSMDTEMLNSIFRMAAFDGDRPLFDRYLQEARKSTDVKERRRFLFSMGQFRNPDIARSALQVVLQDDFDIRESVNILWGVLDTPETRVLGYEFVIQNFDALTEKLPRDYGAYLSSAGTVFCDEENRKRVEEFFGPRARNFTGGPQMLNESLEIIRQCSALREIQGKSVAKFLEKYKH